MLTKKQLEDAYNCYFRNCEECGCNGLQREHGAFDCMTEVIKTALTYREMLERLEWSGVHREIGIYMCPICEALCSDKHKPDCELAKLLKESEVEHDAML